MEVLSDQLRGVRFDLVHHRAAAVPSGAALYGDIGAIYRGNKVVRINKGDVTRVIYLCRF